MRISLASALPGTLAHTLSGTVAGTLAALVLLLGAGCSKDTRFSGVEPNTGTFSGGEEVKIEGANFPRGGVTVRFGRASAQAAVVESDSLIRVTTPSGDKNANVDVTLLFDDGRSYELKSGFRYVDANQQRATMDKFFDKTAPKKTP